ncbi:hypothetical protein [Streptomyces tendae]|uniref:hypothetical protein n=1 Tax=Streptomyces tendae TaxID=1932 RepID=UPI00248FCD85|nr:hypothetical protein [Streptomyces tendae]
MNRISSLDLRRDDLARSGLDLQHPPAPLAVLALDLHRYGGVRSLGQPWSRMASGTRGLRCVVELDERGRDVLAGI